MCKFPRFAETTRAVVGDVMVASAVFRCVTDRQTAHATCAAERLVSGEAGNELASCYYLRRRQQQLQPEGRGSLTTSAAGLRTTGSSSCANRPPSGDAWRIPVVQRNQQTSPSPVSAPCLCFSQRRDSTSAAALPIKQHLSRFRMP